MEFKLDNWCIEHGVDEVSKAWLVANGFTNPLPLKGITETMLSGPDGIKGKAQQACVLAGAAALRAPQIGTGLKWPQNWSVELEKAIGAVPQELLSELVENHNISLTNLFGSDQKLVAAAKRTLAAARMKWLVRVKTQTRKIAESMLPILIDGPVEGAFGQDGVEFAWVYYQGTWNVGKVGGRRAIEEEFKKFEASQGWSTPALISGFKLMGLRDDRAVLIMPHVGQPVSKLIETHQSGLPFELVDDLVACVLAALTALAHQGLSHNDIKPGNVTGSTHSPSLWTLIDLGSVEYWESKNPPATTPGYGGDRVANTPGYDVYCLGQLVQKMAPKHPAIEKFKSWQIDAKDPGEVAAALRALAVSVASESSRPLLARVLPTKKD